MYILFRAYFSIICSLYKQKLNIKQKTLDLTFLNLHKKKFFNFFFKLNKKINKVLDKLIFLFLYNVNKRKLKRIDFTVNYGAKILIYLINLIFLVKVLPKNIKIIKSYQAYINYHFNIIFIKYLRNRLILFYSFFNF